MRPQQTHSQLFAPPPKIPSKRAADNTTSPKRIFIDLTSLIATSSLVARDDTTIAACGATIYDALLEFVTDKALDTSACQLKFLLDEQFLSAQGTQQFTKQLTNMFLKMQSSAEYSQKFSEIKIVYYDATTQDSALIKSSFLKDSNCSTSDTLLLSADQHFLSQQETLAIPYHCNHYGTLDTDEKTAFMQSLSTAKPEQCVIYIDLDDSLILAEQSKLEEQLIFNLHVLNYIKELKQQYPQLHFKILTARPNIEEHYDPNLLSSTQQILDALAKDHGISLNHKTDVIYSNDGKKQKNKIYFLKQDVKQNGYTVVGFIDDNKAEIIFAQQQVKSLQQGDIKLHIHTVGSPLMDVIYDLNDQLQQFIPPQNKHHKPDSRESIALEMLQKLSQPDTEASPTCTMGHNH